MTTTNHEPVPYLEHVTNIEGAHIADCEACGRESVIVYDAHEIYACIPGTGCNSSWEAIRAHRPFGQTA